MNRGPAVFVIDDDAAIQEALNDLLGRWGVRAHAFFSAESFLEQCGDDWTGCLLIDVLMPGMSGLDLLKELRSRGSTLPAIVMTGHGKPGSEEEALAAGAVYFLEKPFQVEQLKDCLARQCAELFPRASDPRL
jgi:FixJ family two-component response regulator